MVEGLAAMNVAAVDPGLVVAAVAGVVFAVVAVTGKAGLVLGTHGGRRTDCSLWGSIGSMFSLSIPEVLPRVK